MYIIIIAGFSPDKETSSKYWDEREMSLGMFFLWVAIQPNSKTKPMKTEVQKAVSLLKTWKTNTGSQ